MSVSDNANRIAAYGGADWNGHDGSGGAGGAEPESAVVPEHAGGNGCDCAADDAVESWHGGADDHEHFRHGRECEQLWTDEYLRRDAGGGSRLHHFGYIYARIGGKPERGDFRGGQRDGLSAHRSADRNRSCAASGAEPESAGVSEYAGGNGGDYAANDAVESWHGGAGDHEHFRHGRECEQLRRDEYLRRDAGGGGKLHHFGYIYAGIGGNPERGDFGCGQRDRFTAHRSADRDGNCAASGAEPESAGVSESTVGTSATAMPMTLSNPGTAALTITGISVTGTNASSFGQTNNCGATLAVGASCTITVTFTPASAASLSAAISVANSASGSPQTAALTGTGVAPLIPQAVLSPGSLTFASTTINTPATPLPLTLSNSGNAPLSISSIAVTGANANSYGQTNNCGATLAAGASCTITVSFTPTAAGTLTAAVVVADNAAGSPQSATLTGTGSTATYMVNFPVPTESIQPGSVAVFSLVVNPLGGSYNNPVTLSATGLPPGATVSFLPAAVTPGSGGASSVMTIQTTTGLARLARPGPWRQSPVPLLALLVGVPLLGLAGSFRRARKASGRWIIVALVVLTLLPVLALSGCGGGYFGPAPKTYSITVTGTSGSLTESTTISLTVQ